VAKGCPFSTLSAAAACGASKLLQLLIDAGAPLDATTGNALRVSALHYATEYPIYETANATLSPGERVARSLRCIKKLLRAGADSRVRRFDGALAVEAVLVVGDLRIADAIFAAEEQRGVVTDDAFAARKWPEHMEWERMLRAAVAAYRVTGDATVPEGLRLKARTLEDDPQVQRMISMSGARPGEFTACMVEDLDDPALVESVQNVRFVEAASARPEMAARQAAVAAQAPREADATERRCAAPDCGMMGALLKACPCRSAWYCGYAPRRLSVRCFFGVLTPQHWRAQS
jgi:hypothetical protein